MNLAKRSQIKKMLSFLNYKENDTVFVSGIVLPDMTWASCDAGGYFYKNHGLSRRPWTSPSDDVIDYVHDYLSNESNRKIIYISNKCRINFLDFLIVKLYRLNFLLK